MSTFKEERIIFQEKLEELLGSRNVYFQPPENVKLQYPVIIYHRSKIDNKHADNAVYNQRQFFEVTIIDKKADSEISEEFSKFPHAKFDRHYTADNLHHYVYTIYL